MSDGLSRVHEADDGWHWIVAGEGGRRFEGVAESRETALRFAAEKQREWGGDADPRVSATAQMSHNVEIVAQMLRMYATYIDGRRRDDDELAERIVKALLAGRAA